MRTSQKVKGGILHNLCDTTFYMKMNELHDIHICISVPLMIFFSFIYDRAYRDHIYRKDRLCVMLFIVI